MKILLLFTALVAATCSNKKDDPTKLAVTNSAGGATTIEVKTADNSKAESFASVGNGLTSDSREISFGSLTNVQISCSSGTTCQAGTLNLESNKTNTVTVFAGSTPSLSSTSSGGGSSW
jgi:hypothetical protein